MSAETRYDGELTEKEQEFRVKLEKFIQNNKDKIKVKYHKEKFDKLMSGIMDEYMMYNIEEVVLMHKIQFYNELISIDDYWKYVPSECKRENAFNRLLREYGYVNEIDSVISRD